MKKYTSLLHPKNLEQTIDAIKLKQSPPEDTDVQITFTSELMMDVCVRIKRLEDQIFLAGGTVPENGANLIED